MEENDYEKDSSSNDVSGCDCRCHAFTAGMGGGSDTGERRDRNLFPVFREHGRQRQSRCGFIRDPLYGSGDRKEHPQHEAWAPFGEGRNGLFDEPVLAQIGTKYGKTLAQVILRWHLQRNTIVIPKSTHYDRMVQNINVFDFTLSDEDMANIAALDKKQSSFFSHYDPNMVEWFVKMVEERKTNHRSEKERKAW